MFFCVLLQWWFDLLRLFNYRFFLYGITIFYAGGVRVVNQYNVRPHPNLRVVAFCTRTVVVSFAWLCLHYAWSLLYNFSRPSYNLLLVFFGAFSLRWDVARVGLHHFLALYNNLTGPFRHLFVFFF